MLLYYVITLTLDPLNPKSIGIDKVSSVEDYYCAMFQVIPISSFRFIMLTYTPPHTHTNTHCDKVIAISTPLYYIVYMDKNNSSPKVTFLFPFSDQL